MNVRHSNLALGARYFGVVFGAGFALGTMRVLWLVPRLGERWAELLEMPVMGLVMFAAARGMVRRDPARSTSAWLVVGSLALALLVAAELTLAWVFEGASPRDAILQRDPVVGVVYGLMLLGFAALPAWQSRRG
jgi:hypothetical protein